ncbi:MAG: hypothetical protein ABF651_00040 [Sporolactobacillus sp.]
MRAIGIRVKPSEVLYTVLEKKDSDEKYIFKINTLNLPQCYNNDFPRQLSFIRTTFHSIICEYNIKYAGIRTHEGNTRTFSIPRINIEGVIQELFSDSTIIHYFAGTLNSIASRLGKNVSDIKECRNGETNLFGISNWNNMTKEKRESYLAALASIPRGDL